MSCGGCCQDFVTCCQFNMPCSQPVTTSGPAICSAECATIGTPCTVNALVSSGFGTLTAILTRKQQAAVAKTAVKAQAQVATAQISMWTWVIVGGMALLAFVFFAGKK